MQDEEKDRLSAGPGDNPRQGQVFKFIKTDKGIFPWEILEKFQKKAPKTHTKQIKEEKRWYTENGLIPPPFPPEALLSLAENCSFFDHAVRQIAKDVVANGWRVELRDGEEKEDDAIREKIEGALKDPAGSEESLEDVLERAVIDWGILGGMALEVSRDPTTREVNGIFHINAHTIRIHKTGDKFCQTRGQEKVWFKRFGAEEDISAEDGKPTTEAAKRANELVYYRNYYPRSSWYGAPAIISSTGAARGLISIKEYNLAFFENYGVPAGIISLEGEWEEEAAQHISDFIDTEIKGSANAHKTLVLNPPEGGKVTWVPMIVEIKEGHFKLYQKDLRDEVLMAYKMPPYRIGIAEVGSLGGNTALEATRVYLDSVVAPLQAVMERIVSEKIIKAGLGDEKYEFILDRVDVRDETAEIDKGVKLFGVAAMSPNEIRESAGLAMLDPKEHPWADGYYLSSGYRPVDEAMSPEGMAMRDGAIEKLETDLAEILKAAKEQKPGGPTFRTVKRISQ